MIGFPGAIYTETGRRADRRGAHLTVERLHGFLHRVVASRRPSNDVAVIWALRDDAVFEEIPIPYAEGAVEIIRAGFSVLLLGDQVETIRNLREMLLACCLIADDTDRLRLAA